MSEEHDDAVTTKHDGETTGEALDALRAIIAEMRDKYTVHDCDECDFRKSCDERFDNDECKSKRKSISLAFGIEDDYFARLADRIEAAVKRERDEWFSGNPVSMRTALIQCELFLGNIERHGHSKLNPGDECVACKGASELRSQVNAAIDAPNHAKLGNDAPARNVDKLETKEAALAALKKRFPVEENFAGFKMAVEWLLDTQDFCLAWPVSHRFGFSNQEGDEE